MRQEVQDNQLLELTQEATQFHGVCFDPDTVTLEGFYTDELSAHRARQNWALSLRENFLLDIAHDIKLRVRREDEGRFLLTCSFHTACGRYAFWRLTNNQAPEAQYQIETAHIPDAEARYEEFLSAPDLRSVDEMPLVIQGTARRDTGLSSVKEILARIIQRLGA